MIIHVPVDSSPYPPKALLLLTMTIFFAIFYLKLLQLFFSFIKWLNFIKWLWCLKYSVSLWSKSISNLLFTHRHTNCFLKHHPYNNQNICVCNLCFFLAKSSLAVIRHNNVNIPMMDDTKDSLSLSHIGIIELSHFIWLQLSFLQCTHINLTRCLSGLLTQRAL